MNKYFWLATIAAFIAWSGFMYYEGGSKQKVICGQADAKHDLAQAAITVAAQNSVIATVAQQQSITQGVDNAYQTKTNYIDGVYASNINSVWGQQAIAACNYMPAISSTTSKPHEATTRPFVTAVFKLNAKECDDNTEQLYELQKWVDEQRKIK